MIDLFTERSKCIFICYPQGCLGQLQFDRCFYCFEGNAIVADNECIPTNVQAKAVYEYFIDEYVEKMPLDGNAFTTYAAEVHTYIVWFTSGNKVVEANMVAHAS